MAEREFNVLMVKVSVALLSSFALIGALSGSADDILPPRFDFDRYKAMVDRSPFAVATAVALPAATPDFAKDLYIANAAHSPEGDLATLMSSSDHNFKKYLTTREPVDGYSIAQIEWSEDVGKTKVTISKDGNFATLTFNEALLAKQQGQPNARSAVAPSRQPPPLVPPSVPSQASRSRSPEAIEEDLEVAANVLPPPLPKLAARAAPERERTYLPQPRQQNDDALSARERTEVEEASRK